MLFLEPYNPTQFRAKIFSILLCLILVTLLAGYVYQIRQTAPDSPKNYKTAVKNDPPAIVPLPFLVKSVPKASSQNTKSEPLPNNSGGASSKHNKVETQLSDHITDKPEDKPLADGKSDKGMELPILELAEPLTVDVLKQLLEQKIFYLIVSTQSIQDQELSLNLDVTHLPNHAKLNPINQNLVNKLSSRYFDVSDNLVSHVIPDIHYQISKVFVIKPNGSVKFKLYIDANIDRDLAKSQTNNLDNKRLTFKVKNGTIKPFLA